MQLAHSLSWQGRKSKSSVRRTWSNQWGTHQTLMWWRRTRFPSPEIESDWLSFLKITSYFEIYVRPYQSHLMLPLFAVGGSYKKPAWLKWKLLKSNYRRWWGKTWCHVIISTKVYANQSLKDLKIKPEQEFKLNQLKSGSVYKFWRRLGKAWWYVTVGSEFLQVNLSGLIWLLNLGGIRAKSWTALMDVVSVKGGANNLNVDIQ